MKTNFTKLGLLFFAIIGLSSCITEVDLPDSVAQVPPPTPAEFNALEETALENMTQNFNLNVSDGYTTFVTVKGTMISIDPSCLRKNGNAVTGAFTMEVVEIFDRGSMLVANKPTTATVAGGERKLLISGGEFSVKAFQDGVELETNCGYQIQVPTSLSGGDDYDMAPFTGTINAQGELVWAVAQQEFWISNNQGPTGGGESYYSAFIESFGWFNCDKFANFTGPMTEISVLLPQGYNNENSSVFIGISGEPNTLGYLYGQFPVGLNCYIIFVTEEDGLWSYGIKTIASLPNGASYSFDASELQTGTMAEVVDAINALL